MTSHHLRYKDKLSKKQAIDKIRSHALYGDHSIEPRPKTIEEVQQYFIKRGVNTDELVQKCRNPKTVIPNFENMIGAVWHASGNVSLVDGDGDTVFEMKEPGLFIWSNYKAHFEAACDARDRAVEKNSYSSFQECLTQGFASIESFINTQALEWNKQHPDDLLEDSSENKVSMQTKLDEWIPKMTNGATVIKNDHVWNHFRSLLRLRDQNAIHPHSPGQGVSYKMFQRQLNSFRYGIALFLGRVHLLFGQAVPSVIVTAVSCPNVEIADAD